MPLHTQTYKGRKIIIRLKSGETLTGQFKQRRSKVIELLDGRKIPRRQIAMQSIWHHAPKAQGV